MIVIFFNLLRLIVKMSNRQVSARASISGPGGYVITTIHPRPCFDFLSLLVASWFGLPCACCYETNRWSPAGDYHYDKNGRFIQSFCDHCNAVICNSCSYYIMDNHGGQQLGCRWCGGDISRTMCSSHEKEFLSLETSRANSNIRNFFCKLGTVFSRIFPNQNISQVFWADIVSPIGWRFFIDFDVRLIMAHPTQFGLLMSMMIRNSFSEFQRLQPVLPSFHREFSELPNHMGSLYRKSREFVITHSFSVLLTYKLTDSRFTRKYSLTILRRVLAKEAEKLTARLGICDLEEYDQNDLSD
jgi:hypothetical protein